MREKHAQFISAMCFSFTNIHINNFILLFPLLMQLTFRCRGIRLKQGSFLE